MHSESRIKLTGPVMVACQWNTKGMKDKHVKSMWKFMIYKSSNARQYQRQNKDMPIKAYSFTYCLPLQVQLNMKLEGPSVSHSTPVKINNYFIFWHTKLHCLWCIYASSKRTNDTGQNRKDITRWTTTHNNALPVLALVFSDFILLTAKLAFGLQLGSLTTPYYIMKTRAHNIWHFISHQTIQAGFVSVVAVLLVFTWLSSLFRRRQKHFTLELTGNNLFKRLINRELTCLTNFLLYCVRESSQE